MKTIDQSVVDAVVRTLESQRLFRYDGETPDDCVAARLEQRFARLIGAEYALAVNSCSSALFLTLVCAGVRPGDQVLIPAFTFIAVPSAVIHAGATPLLVEVTDDYYLDSDDLERKIGPQTKCLLLSYMRGRVPDLDRVTAICRRRGVTLVEDAAHSLGVLYGGIPTGRFGRAAAFSAQSYKLIDGGEGGILTTDDRDLALAAMLYAGCYERNWRKHFLTAEDAEQLDRMVNAIPAYNFRISELTAAALLPQLDRIEARVAYTNGLYEAFCAALAESPKVRIPEFHAKVRPAADSAQFEVIGASPQGIANLVRRSEAAGVKMSAIGDPKNARAFWNWTFFKPNDCPRTRQLLERTIDLRLPLRLEPQGARAWGHALVGLLSEVE